VRRSVVMAALRRELAPRAVIVAMLDANEEIRLTDQIH
jgi:hypothetical protein